jgi:ferredoxin
MKIIIDKQLCHNCGICGDVCPRHIPETISTDGQKATRVSPERADLCMACGHCAAVCPHGAIQLEGQPLTDYGSMEKLTLNEGQLLMLMRQRRSVRRYKKKAVPRESIDRLIQATACAPTGTGRRSTGVMVLDHPDTLAKFSEQAFKMYEDLEKGLRNPIARVFITREAGKQQVHSLQEFVLPGMRWYLRWYHEGKSNEILRDCPALLLFHSPANETAGLQNCIIAALQAAFMAETLGLGACLNDLIPAACNHSAAIRALLGLPADREVHASMTFGYPLYRFQRVPPRGLAEVRYLD